MLFVFTGDALAREKARIFIDGLLKKKPEATLTRINGDNWSKDELRALAGAASLFAGNCIVRCDDLFALREGAEHAIELLPFLAESSNIFIFVEDKLSADDKNILEKHAKEIKVYDGEKKGKGKREKGSSSPIPSFNIYALSDAFAEKKRRELWLLYHEALFAGIPPEEIFWKFVWQLRLLIVAAKTGMDGLAAMKVSPYPAQKALAAARDWKEMDLLKLSERFVKLYHDHETFRGDPDLEFAMERVILSL